MWAFGLQELQPSFPPSLGKDQVHPAAHSKGFIWGMQHKLRLIPGGMVSPFGQFRPEGLMISAGV